ncbi:MAG: DUF3473 domain-containing protein [Gammaproteobacteria bacterium]|nr:DUF3473 domain-containing protein [Gammaproteobacteria bacterium]
MNAISVDVEDYYQVSAFSKNIHRDNWEAQESRVVSNTHKLLDIFDGSSVKCTFFVLGWVAERHKDLVKEIASRGHEVACHGYSHRLIYEQSPEEFREETFLAKQILEDIIQTEVTGYRAASYSITRKSLWALDVLADAGFQYDSSIFPVRHDRYGIPDADSVPHILTTPSGKNIVEFPLTTMNILGYKLPMAGGGYFRLYPYLLTKLGLRYVSKVERNPIIFYLHPWEIDPDQPRIESSWFSKFRHYNNLDKCEARLERLISDFSFNTVTEVLNTMNLLGTEAGDVNRIA